MVEYSAFNRLVPGSSPGQPKLIFVLFFLSLCYSLEEFKSVILIIYNIVWKVLFCALFNAIDRRKTLRIPINSNIDKKARKGILNFLYEKILWALVVLPSTISLYYNK